MSRPVLRRAVRGISVALLLAVSLFVNASVCQLCEETLWRGSFSLSAAWMYRRIPDFAFTSLWLSLAAGALFFLCGHLTPAMMLSNLLYCILGLVERYKYAFSGTHLQTGDFMLAREAMGIVGKFRVTVDSKMLIALIVGVLVVPSLFLGIRLPHTRKRLAGLLSHLLPALVSLSFLFFLSDGYARNKPVLDNSIHEDVGLLRALLPASAHKLDKPADYSQDSVQALLTPYVGSGSAPAVLPDIYFIMSESLFDIDALGTFSVSGDPLAHFRQLQKDNAGGSLSVAVYGGGTANTEYEVLTGYRCHDTAIMPYMDSSQIPEGMSSIVTMLRDYGYYTLAMHPNTGKFYNRKNAYSILGFDASYFSENMAPVTDAVGPFPSDAYLFDQLLAARNEAPADKPVFAHVVTYQNHGDYNYDYDRRVLSVSGTADDEARLNALNYVNAVSYSDETMQHFLDSLAASERPSVVLIYGDHCPNLRLMGINRDTLDARRAAMTMQTPYLLWNNFGKVFPALPDPLPTYRLGASVMHGLGFDADAYLNALADDSSPLNAEKTAAGALLLLHYDRIYGENYSQAFCK